ncbi:MAG: tRNA1(Val) (adenine(37)-N6)-methyltransferase [bacterium]
MESERIQIREDEEINDLLPAGLKIIQSKRGFRFGMDAVLLANFLDIRGGSAIDLGTGNGVIPLILSQITEADPIYGIEIREDEVERARKNVLLNHLQDRIKIVWGDLRSIRDVFPPASFDFATCNPPYEGGDVPLSHRKGPKIPAKHEIFCTLEDAVGAAAYLLREGGKVGLVYRPARLVQLLSTLRAHRLEPKRILFVHPRWETEAKLVLVEGTKGGRPGLKALPPLFAHEEGGKFTPELEDMYYKKLKGRRPARGDIPGMREQEIC